MAGGTWMIYGANGYTGRLVAETAVRHGHKPILAGRSRDAVAPLAERLGLPGVAVALEDRDGLARALAGVDLVYLAAGPFARTSAPMLRACLDAGVNYVDIAGEIPVIENALAFDGEARSRGVLVLPAAGFDVVPTDCLARYVADRTPGAVELELAVRALTRVSRGTAVTMLDMLPQGGFVVRGGRLVPDPIGARVKPVRFSDGRTVLCSSAPWGDLATAPGSTGIGNVTTYIAYPRAMIRALRFALPLLSIGPIRAGLQAIARRTFIGPGERSRATERSFLWARASDGKGGGAEAWLETGETYRFTADAAIRVVEKVLANRPTGALTPAQAFGADFVLEIEGTRRHDQ